MQKKILDILFANLGAKAIALVLALIVWILVTGNENAFSERTLSVHVDVANIPKNIEVQSVNPPEVRLSLRNSRRFAGEIKADKLRLAIDLKGVTRGGKLSFYAEDFLEIPPGIDIVSLHPKRIEVFLEELASREVEVHARFVGHLPEGRKLKDARCQPERVTIFGYKTQIDAIDLVYTQDIDLGAVTVSTSLRTALKQPGNVLKFLDRKEVEVQIEIEERGAVQK